MKKPSIIVYAVLVALFLVAAPGFSQDQDQEYGKIRIRQQRADHVIKKKNDFIALVLTSYNIPHERNAQGVVVRINVDGQWLNVTAIEVVPVLKETTDKHQQVVAHELFFHTAHGILNVVSELTIR
jgi:hypothetical protein